MCRFSSENEPAGDEACGGSMRCRFFQPTRFSFATRVPMSKTLFTDGIGSEALSITTSMQECCWAEAGGVQGHSRITGIPGLNDAMVCAAPIGCHCVVLVESPGNASQKSFGKFARPVPASVQRIFTLTFVAGWKPRLCSCT